MSSVSTPIQRGRILRQAIPTPPPKYDQTYMSQLAAAVNDYMLQASAPGDVVGARFIMSDFPVVEAGNNSAYPDTSQFPLGMLYLLPLPGTPGAYYLTVMLPPGQFVGTGYIRLNPNQGHL
jgi:hypothetical protein